MLFTVNVKNTGGVESDAVVLCFVSSGTNRDGPRCAKSQENLASYGHLRTTPRALHYLHVYVHVSPLPSKSSLFN